MYQINQIYPTYQMSYILDKSKISNKSNLTNMTKCVLNMNKFVLKVTEYVLCMTGFVLNKPDMF